jgi:WD40 repeat protein
MFSPDFKDVVSASFDSTIVISQLAAEVYQEVFEDKKEKITSACYSPRDDIFMSVHHDKLKIWESHSKRLLQTIPCDHTPVAPMFSPDGSKIAMGVDGVLKIWDVKQNKWYNSFSGRYEHIVTFNPSGDELLTTDWNCDLDSAFIWKIKDGTVIRGWEINEFATTYVTYNHTGTLLATGYMDYAKIWTIPSDTIKYFNDISFGYTTRSVSSAAFSMDDNFLTIGCTDGSILVWDIEADSIIHQTISAHQDAVTSIAFSPDGKYYLTTSHDSFVKVWDASKHVLVFIIDIKDGEIVSASFNSKGNRIMASTSHHKVFFTDFPPLQQLIDEISERYKNRQLTPEERRKYYLE